MSCSAPIDIVKSQSENCDLKCDYSFDYNNTSITATNKGEYILFTFDKDNSSPVLFNKENYNVTDMRLYQPSLHTYSGSHADAELIIRHNNIGKDRNILVCIPIGVGNSTIMDNIITQVSQRANTTDRTTNINIVNFSLNKIVPKKHYFSYEGTLPYYPCSGSYDYVVFDRSNKITVTSDSINILKKIIIENVTNIKTPNAGLFYSKQIAKRLNKGDGDDIYIECHPTGEDGEMLVPQEKNLVGGGNIVMLDKFKDIFSNKYFNAIIGVILIVVLIHLFSLVADKVFSVSGKNSAIVSQKGGWKNVFI